MNDGKIRVTIWYEYTQESGQLKRELLAPDISDEDFGRYQESTRQNSEKIKAVYPDGLANTIADHLKKNAAPEDHQQR